MLHSLLIPPIRDTAKSCRCSGQSSVPVYSICTTINKWLNHHKEQPNTTSGKPTSAHAIFSPMWIRVRHCNSAVKWHGKNFGLWLQSIFYIYALLSKENRLDYRGELISPFSLHSCWHKGQALMQWEPPTSLCDLQPWGRLEMGE